MGARGSVDALYYKQEGRDLENVVTHGGKYIPSVIRETILNLSCKLNTVYQNFYWPIWDIVGLWWTYK
jgi:hypothetical protein